MAPLLKTVLKWDLHTQKTINFVAVSIEERVVMCKSDGNIKDAHDPHKLKFNS